MDEPIRTDKEDRYFSAKIKVTSSSPKCYSFMSKKKLITLLLPLLIIILLLFFAILKPNVPSESTIGAIPDINTQKTSEDEYHILMPLQISRDATKTKKELSANQERLEIPGEITDLLAQKITRINQHKSQQSNIELKSQDIDTNLNVNELPLGQLIEDTHYTIQINATSSIEGIMAFVKLHKLSNYQIYETRRGEKPWFVLIKGNYSTLDNAKEAIKLLSPDVQSNSPWIKSGIAINKEKLSS